MKEKLKPCPFCGSDDIGIKDNIIEKRKRTSIRRVWAYCRYCGSEGRKMTIEAVDGLNTDIGAAGIESWENRAKDACKDTLSREENIRAILESNFAGFKDEIIEIAVKGIAELDQGLCINTETAIKPKRQQEHCEDTISREEAIKALDENKYSSNFCVEHNIDWSINLGMAHIAIKELPPVFTKPKAGYWIPVPEYTDWHDATYRCSCCNREIIIPYETTGDLITEYPYCHCGAKMAEDGERKKEAHRGKA